MSIHTPEVKKRDDILPIKVITGYLYDILLIICAAIIFSVSAANAGLSDKDVFEYDKRFDLGPAGSPVRDHFIPVGPNNRYTRSAGFGLISNGGEWYDYTPEGLLTDKLSYDGIADDSEIKFRVDLDPGEYWIELYMAGGEFNIWTGEIIVNGKLLADSLRAYASSFEGEEPPPYWTLMRKVQIDDPMCVIEIKAHDQPSTLSGLLIFKAANGKIQLAEGKLIMTEPFKYPNAGFALRLINEGKIDEAQRLIDPIPGDLLALEKASLLVALAGRLEVTNPRAYLEWAASLLDKVYDEDNIPAAKFNLRLIELYLEADRWYKMAGWDWATYLTHRGIFDRMDMAGFSFEKVSEIPGHTLSFQAAFQLGKLTFWGYVEQHGDYKLKIAQKRFSQLLPYYPDHLLLRMYAGERIPSKKINYHPSTGTPEWAFWAGVGLENIIETIHYWVDNRQADDGQFGGKYDDDVEMLRWWPIARMASDDQKTLLGLHRLVNGIWESPWITEGFSTKLRDVEHSSEPVADTQPMMIGLDYGNPVYVERCMQSIRRLNDLWTGINQHGHRHFRSSWYSYNAIDQRPPRDCDVPMNTRTIKSLRWLAWYNNHPVAMQFLREWGDAWLEDCLRTDKGKPYGIVPAAVRYEDDAIGGHSDNWHHPDMFWGYFNFHGGADMLMQFLATYDLTGDERYLKPIELAIELVRQYEELDLSEAEPGSEEWTARILKRSREVAEVFEQWRLITGKDDYDALLVKYGSDFLKYRLSRNDQFIIDGNKRVVEGIMTNHALLTTEGYFTDRIEIGNMHENQVWGASHLESIYTGSSLSEGFYPFHSVTWQGFGKDFAAVVAESSENQLTILAYNLDEQIKEGQLFCWRLTPGEYLLSWGKDLDQDRMIDAVEHSEKISIQGRGSPINVKLQPAQQQVIEIKRISSPGNFVTRTYADLAITKSDIVITLSEDQEIHCQVPVHNIGTMTAKEFKVEFKILTGKENQVIGERHIAELSAPLDLIPKIKIVKIAAKVPVDPDLRIMVEIDPDNRVEEITEINNRITLKLKDFPN